MYTGDLPPLQALYEQAVLSARSGRRQEAAELFYAYLDLDDCNPQVWYWLSELLEDPHERTAALKTALGCCLPGTDLHARIQERLAKVSAHAEPNGPALIFNPGENPLEEIQEKIQQGLRLAASGKQMEGLSLLEKVAAEDPLNERAWLALSEVYAGPREKIRALERALEINPYSAEAHQRRDRLREVEEDPLKRGSFLEARGDMDGALEVYRYVNVHSHLPSDRLEAHQRMEAIRLREEAAAVHRVDPNINLLRLSFGPAALFMMMVFIQSGLNPLHAPLVTLAGVVCVMCGGLLVSAVEMVPAHPYWVKIFGQPGEGDEPEIRRGLHLLGLALLLAPFTIFFIEAGLRLGALRAAMFGP